MEDLVATAEVDNTLQGIIPNTGVRLARKSIEIPKRVY